MRRQFQRREQHHRAVGAADQRDRRRVLQRITAEHHRQRQRQHRAQFRKQRDDRADVGTRHHEADVEQRADADKDQARDQAVAERQRVDRLKPVDLH